MSLSQFFVASTAVRATGALRRVACLFLFFLFVSFAFASPFIVADPQSATLYRMRLSADNGNTWGTWVEGNPVNGALRFDIAGTPAGNYRGEAQAGGNVTVVDSVSGQSSSVFMWSASAPFVLNVVPGQTIMNIKVVD